MKRAKIAETIAALLLLSAILPMALAASIPSNEDVVSGIRLLSITWLSAHAPTIGEPDLGSPFSGNSTSAACSVSAGSSLTIHVIASGVPVQDAGILLNGTYVCNGELFRSVLYGTTNSQGNAVFAVVPGAYYMIIVTPPLSISGASPVALPITGPPPMTFTTTTVSLIAHSYATGMGSDEAIPVSLGAIILLTGLLVGGVMSRFFRERSRAKEGEMRWKVLERVALALKICVFMICFAVACCLAFIILITLPWSGGDCPACWPPSLSYLDLFILPVALIIDVVVLVLVARSLNNASKQSLQKAGGTLG